MNEREGESSIVGHGIQLEGWLDREGVMSRAELTTDVWDGLIRYLNLPSSIKVSNSSSTSRQTKDEQGNGPMLHTTGQKPHAGVRMVMVNILINYYFLIYSNFINVF